MTEIKPKPRWQADYEAQQAAFRADMKRENRTMAIIMGSILFIFVSGLGTLLWLGIKHQRAVHDRFMAGCVQDHKEYECIALWRASDGSPPVFLPIPLPIPTGK